MSDERKILELEEIGGVDDTLQAVTNGEKLHVSISNDWAGDTITGIGESGEITLTKAQGEKFRNFLNDWLSS